MVQKATEKAASLIEALPYIQRFRGETVVVKFGGSILEDPRNEFAFEQVYQVYESERKTWKLLDFFVNAGIYLLEPSVYRFIPAGQRYDMTDLINRLLEEARPVAGFPITEYWLDVGDKADYERAVQDVKDWKPAS